MTEPIGGPSRTIASRRNPISGLILGLVALAVCGSAQGGVIRHPTVQTRSIVEIQKADPNSGYWERALRLHTLKLAGPRVHNLFALNADGSVAATAFVRYMVWREGLDVKRFDSFHPQIAQQLRRVKFPKTPVTSPSPPGTYVPPTGSVPIQPPDFTPVTEQGLNPPHVPEPPSAFIGAALIGAAALYRHWTRRA